MTRYVFRLKNLLVSSLLLLGLGSLLAAPILEAGATVPAPQGKGGEVIAKPKSNPKKIGPPRKSPASFHAQDPNIELVRIPTYRLMMGKYEVTQAQWQAVMGNNPSHFKDCGNCPVEQVSWNDAHDFIRKLNEIKNGYTYRLPTKAEWEHACGAGTTDDSSSALDSVAWYGNNSGNNSVNAQSFWNQGPTGDVYNKRLVLNGNRTHTVGTKQPNSFGLYDMNGNVYEWCEDREESVGYRVIRGGSYRSPTQHLGCTNWSVVARLGDRSNDIGFRVVAVERPR